MRQAGCRKCRVDVNIRRRNQRHSAKRARVRTGISCATHNASKAHIARTRRNRQGRRGRHKTYSRVQRTGAGEANIRIDRDQRCTYAKCHRIGISLRATGPYSAAVKQRRSAAINRQRSKRLCAADRAGKPRRATAGHRQAASRNAAIDCLVEGNIRAGQYCGGTHGYDIGIALRPTRRHSAGVQKRCTAAIDRQRSKRRCTANSAAKGRHAAASYRQGTLRRRRIAVNSVGKRNVRAGEKDVVCGQNNGVVEYLRRSRIDVATETHKALQSHDGVGVGQQ